MADGNGSPVTWRELNLLHKTIEQRFNALEGDIAEIKWGMNLVLENKRQRMRAWGPPIIAALISTAIALPIALMTH